MDATMDGLIRLTTFWITWQAKATTTRQSLHF
jgi:hypothetical protein